MTRKKKSYLDQLYDKRMIDNPMRSFKMRVFLQLYTYSAAAFAKPKSSGDMDDTSHGTGAICALENRAKYAVKRMQLLRRCNDEDEKRFLDYYSRWDKDIFADIEKGFIEFKYTKAILNSALLDICKALKGEKNG